MPQITTIEEFYEYRMKRIVKQFLEGYDSEDLPTDGDKLFEELWRNSADFGRLVIDDMSAWMEESWWYDEAQS